jgi:hypothetical protein
MIKLHSQAAIKHSRSIVGKLMALVKQKYSWQNRFFRCSQIVNWACGRWKRYYFKRLAYKDYIDAKFSEAISDIVLRDNIAIGSEAISKVIFLSYLDEDEAYQ